MSSKGIRFVLVMVVVVVISPLLLLLFEFELVDVKEVPLLVVETVVFVVVMVAEREEARGEEVEDTG